MDVVSKSKSDKQSFNSSVRSFYKSLFAIGAVVCTGAVYWQMQDSNVAQQQSLPTDILVEKTPPLLDSTTPLYLVDKQALSIVEREEQQLSFTFEQQVNVNDERGSLYARVHKNTRVSRYSGGAIDYRQLTLHQSDASQFQIEGDVHAFEFGIKDQHLIFSKPIELSINVDYPDGTPVSIYAKHAGQELGQSGLTQDFLASCSDGISSNESNQAIVQNGKVSFATCGASLFVVRDNVDNIEIDTVRGMCLNNRAFQYQVHWHDDSGTVTQMQVIDDNDMVLASGSSSPVIVNKSSSSNRTAFNIRIRDLNNTSDISPRYVVRPEDCRGFDLKTYTSDSQFTVPSNVYAIEVLAIGGGGGGQAVIDGNGNNGPTLAGGGGGGGASASSVISVLPGEVYKVFVGAGGKNNVGESKKMARIVISP